MLSLPQLSDPNTVEVGNKLFQIVELVPVAAVEFKIKN